MTTKIRLSGSEEQDRRTEEWLVGFRLGLVLAEQAGDVMRRAGKIDVLDEEGNVIFSSRVDRLVQATEEVGAGEEE